MSEGCYAMGWKVALLMVVMALSPFVAMCEEASNVSIAVKLEPYPTICHLGDLVSLNYTVSNYGDVGLQNVTLLDLLTSEIIATGMDLSPGDHWSLQRNRTITSSDFDPSQNPSFPTLRLEFLASAEVWGSPVVAVASSPVNLISD